MAVKSTQENIEKTR